MPVSVTTSTASPSHRSRSMPTTPPGRENFTALDATLSTARSSWVASASTHSGSAGKSASTLTCWRAATTRRSETTSRTTSRRSISVSRVLVASTFESVSRSSMSRLSRLSVAVDRLPPPSFLSSLHPVFL